MSAILGVTVMVRVIDKDGNAAHHEALVMLDSEQSMSGNPVPILDIRFGGDDDPSNVVVSVADVVNTVGLLKSLQSVEEDDPEGVDGV